MDVELLKSIKEYRTAYLKKVTLPAEVIEAAEALISNKYYNSKFDYTNKTYYEILDLKDKNGDTALMLAAWNDHKDIVNLLIKAGADLNLKNNFGDTALIWATTYNQKDIAELLINEGANINLKDINGDTALILASFNKDIIELLIKAGADVNLKNNYGN